MLIRPIAPPDLPAFLALLRAKAEFDGHPESLLATVDTLQAALFADQPRAHALVAELDGRLVGMVTYYAIFSSFIARPGLWMDDLFVDAGHRGRGIGEQLVHALCREAQANGCARLDWLVSAANQRGQKFYTRIGATIFDKGRLVRLDEARIQALAAQVAA
jgi:GNAT superfamily N-acetyltransferase